MTKALADMNYRISVSNMYDGLRKRVKVLESKVSELREENKNMRSEMRQIQREFKATVNVLMEGIKVCK